jgi:hypothetical protein
MTTNTETTDRPEDPPIEDENTYVDPFEDDSPITCSIDSYDVCESCT